MLLNCGAGNIACTKHFPLKQPIGPRQMENFDAEFRPVRKSQQEVSANRIIQDISIDHEQQAFLKKIELVPAHKELVEAETLQTVLLPEESNVSGEGRTDNLRKRTYDDSTENGYNLKKVAKLDSSEYSQFRSFLLRQLNNTLPAQEAHLPGFVRDASKEIERILKQSIIQKESHSAIVVGPRSHYKTAIIDYHLTLLCRDFEKQFVIVKLNGFIHSEQAAINSIAFQLEAQLQSLHGNAASGFEISSGSLTEVFEKILRLIDTTTVQNKTSASSRAEKVSVIFIFDEIDTFAGPVRQTLLYNLFDMVEHARVPVCIIGCTTKMNVVEHLEKRVKSRFSQRIVYVPTINALETFRTTIKEQLHVNKDDHCAKNWNECIHRQLCDDKSELNRIIKNNFETFRSTAHLMNSLRVLVQKENSIEGLLNGIQSCRWIHSYNQNQLESSLSAKVKSLSDLELALLIAAGRVSLKTEDNVNFNLAYAEYSNMVKDTNKKMPIIPQATGTSLMLESTLRVWSKLDVKNVWENLIDLDFLTEKGSIGLRVSAQAAFQASNYHTTGTIIPFDLRIYQMQITLQELRRTVSRSSLYYSWTQL
ncbi:origin recognition complex subunit 4 [Lachancea thermotolerans CBS 6340]|uniref:KLTH0F18480p n=1 Tax=Lachancea thermotolerans (strain ATCC 56472 / CBS 6340 / NRRL Y-8284) TaxID=559295 RepID=C5DJR3_LACTC|nr:KLTH0F18480p [Lachancea thermotolerans CBS 6340]CAR24552.1 KLTH0F18480p [Lachancea thermotolerans CBS 6340]